MINYAVNPQQSVETGTIIQHISAYVDGYVLCNGSTLPDHPKYNNLKRYLSDYGGKLPDFRGCFIRGAGGASAAVGTKQAGGLPNITGNIVNMTLLTALGTKYLATGNGAFGNAASGAAKYGTTQGDGVGQSINFNASRSNSLYGAANEVRPVNHALYFHVKI